MHIFKSWNSQNCGKMITERGTWEVNPTEEKAESHFPFHTHSGLYAH